jgi:hypothetical protein
MRDIYIYIYSSSVFSRVTRLNWCRACTKKWGVQTLWHKLTRQDDCVRALQFGPCSFSCFINWEVLSPRFRIACVSGWLYQILPFYETCHRGIPLRTWYVSEIQGSLQFHMTSASFALCIFIHSFILGPLVHE